MTRPAGRDRPVPVVHAVSRYGVPTQTFVRDAIAEVQALGWQSWVVTKELVSDAGPVPRERIVLPRQPAALVDRVEARVAIARGRHAARERSARAFLDGVGAAPRGILHAHFGWAAADCALAARRLGLPFVASFHGTDLMLTPTRAEWRPSYEEMFAAVDAVTVVSRFLEQRLRSLGYDGPVHVVQSGVRLAGFPFRGAHEPGDRPRLLFVGRLIGVKGVDLLLEALAHLAADGVEATLDIVGDGSERAPLEELAGSLGIAAAVRFRGELPHEDVHRTMREADIVVVPSRTMPDGQTEGSSVVAKEAQAVGVPLVATDVGGLPETVRPELRGELVAPERPELLADAIARLWSERGEWAARARAQREWIATEFAWEEIAVRLSAIYEDVLARTRPSRAPLARFVRRRRGGH